MPKNVLEFKMKSNEYCWILKMLDIGKVGRRVARSGIEKVFGSCWNLMKRGPGGNAIGKVGISTLS